MKKIIIRLITVAIIATTINHSALCIPPRKKNDAQARQLTQDINLKMERAQNAQTPEEQQQLKNELINDIEQTTTYFDTVQNVFGYGAIAEKKRAQAEKQKHALEHKLAQEEIRYRTLTSTQAKEKSLEKQNNLKNKIHTEKIALGQAWSWQQKALLGALAAATAYVGYQYGGTMVSTAKEWWNGKTEESMQPSVQTSPTLSERFSEKFTQLKEQGKTLQQKVNDFFALTPDQQTDLLAKQARERKILEEAKQELIEAARMRKEQFSEKFTQLKEQGKALQENATSKVSELLTPSVDQQAEILARKVEENLLWQANERSKLEQTKQDLIAQAQQSKEQQMQQLMQREYAEQQRKIASEQANIERLKRIDNQELLTKSQYLKNNMQTATPNIKNIFYKPINNVEIDETPMTWSEWFNSFFKEEPRTYQ